MKPAPFEYVRPASVADALEALASHPDAKVLAGGQSLVPLLSMRLAAPSVLVDINGLAELATIETDPDPVSGGVRVGALARHAEVEAHAEARSVQPLLSQALRLVAHPTIRNRGTTVGSIVHADAAAERARTGVLIDARVAPRYRGEMEPVDPVAGHIPGAVAFPAADLTAPDGRLRPADELRERFAAAEGREVGAYCGSGVTAAHTVLALHRAGRTDAALYVGSWSEWVADPGRPVATVEG